MRSNVNIDKCYVKSADRSVCEQHVKPKLARMATSTDASTANAKDMDADLQNRSGSLNDTAALHVCDYAPLYFRRCNSDVVIPMLFIRRYTSADTIPPC